jgi:hypothetical protein
MGHTGAGRAVGKQAARTVGNSGGTGEISGQVLAFTEKRLLAEFQKVNWEQREIAEVYGFLRALNASRSKKPEGSRVHPLPVSMEWKHRYPAWFTKSKAGQLLLGRDIWERTFVQYNEPLPGKIRKWVQQGCSVWLDVKKFGR